MGDGGSMPARLRVPQLRVLHPPPPGPTGDSWGGALIDVLVRLLDQIAKSADRVEALRTRELRNEFAQTLLDVYLRSLEVVDTGEEILSALSRMIDSADRVPRDRALSHYAGHVRYL